MNKYILALIVTLAAGLASAQDLVPATSEDIDMFDRQLQEQKEKTEQGDKAKEKKAKADNFGQLVREEAQKLKDEESKKGGLGAFVKEQRRNERAGGGAESSNGKGKGGPQESAPTNPSSDRGQAGKDKENNGRGKNK